MIQKIIIKKAATFLDPGVEIDNLKKVNFIYGSNGTGKTTISNLLYEPERSSFGDCNVEWENNQPILTLVYNKEFRERNFSGSTLNGVFTLGEASVDEIDEIERKKEALDELKSRGLLRTATLEKQKTRRSELESSFKEEVWSGVYKKYERNFKPAFQGVMQKASFLARLITEFNSNEAELKTLDELNEKANTILKNTPLTMNLISNVDFERLLEIESDAIWAKKIIGKADVDIAKLIQRLNLNDWVNEGRKYISENDICPFCQEETISQGFRSQLEKYFDENYVAEINRVKELSEEYVRLADNLSYQLQEIESSEKINKHSKLHIERFAAQVKVLNGMLLTNKEYLSGKLKEPSREFELVPTQLQFEEVFDTIRIANELINKHNILVRNYTVEKTKLVSQIWRFLVDEFDERLDWYTRLRNGLGRGIASIEGQRATLREEFRVLNTEIQELTKNVTSIQPSIDQINRTLLSFGFLNFQIVPAAGGANQYQIQREDGELAQPTLSEGEVTFITFLYYLQLIKGSTNEEDIATDRVIVIDDPISSLDSNVLFVISSLIKEIMKDIRSDNGNIKQIILLTHNVYFHKEVSFINGRTEQVGDTNFWILRKNMNISSVQDCGLNNPIKNSYELLWQELKNREANSGITIQNTMRRIIENYFKILGKYGDDDLMNEFENPQEKEICRSLISWINEGSHTIPDDLYVELQQETIENYFNVFKSVFDKTGHIEHYNMMMN